MIHTLAFRPLVSLLCGLSLLTACAPERPEPQASSAQTATDKRRDQRKRRPAISEEQRAAVRGKYSGLITKVRCPARLDEDRENYGAFGEAGYYEAVAWCGKDFPAAYWVWVDGTWYLWQRKNLEAIGFTTSKEIVPLKKGELVLHFEHHQKNRAWAAEQLKWLAAAIAEMETFTGLPYPGSEPYTIEENPDLPLLGLAGPSGMQLISPPKGTLWTMLHETVHIWNAGVEDKYVCEGLANLISFLMMEHFELAYTGDETYPAYISEWHEIQDTDEDLTLDTHYDELPQGKAMEFWAMAYEIGGQPLIREAFVTSVKQQGLSVAQLKSLLIKHGVTKPDALLSGWVLKGPYLVDESSDAGPVRYPLPAAWE